MDSKVILAAGLFGLGMYWLWKRKNDDEIDTQRANNNTADLNDNATNAALKIKQALDWEKVGGMVWHGYMGGITNSRGDTKARANLFNACLAVTDWKATQKKFSALCGNECTLLDALQETTDNETYNLALELIKGKKVITTTACRAALQNHLVKNNEAVGEQYDKSFAANTILGAYVTTYNGNVSFVNGFATDDYWISEFQDLVKTSGYTSATNVTIVTP